MKLTTSLIIFGIVIATILIAGCAESPKNNDMVSIKTKNITISHTAYGASFGPYYIVSSEPYLYQIGDGDSGRPIYDFAVNHKGETVWITYKDFCNSHNEEVRQIISISPITDNEDCLTCGVTL